MNKFKPKIISIENQNKASDRTLIVSYEYPLYFFIEIKHPETPTNALAYRILQNIKEKFQEGELSPYQNFEEALKETNEILTKLTEEGDTNWIGNLSTIIALIDKETINIASIGNSSCFLIRDKNITEITQEQEQTAHPGKTFSNILSGELIKDDKIIFGNKDFFDHIPLNALRQTLINYTPKNAALNFIGLLKKERIKTAQSLLLEIKEQLGQDSETEPEILYVDSAKKTMPKLKPKFKFPSFHLKQLSFFEKYSKYIYIILALIFGIVLSIIISGTVKKHDNNSNENQRKIIMQAEDKKREADEAIKANNKQAALALYKEAIAIVSPVNNKDGKNLIDKINAEIDRINSIVRVTPKEILSLSFLKQPEVPQIFIVNKDIYFVDKKSNQLYMSKDSKAQLSQSAGAFVSGTYQPQENIIIINQDSEGIFEYKVDDGKLDKAKIVFEVKWEKAKSLATYFTNLYILNPDDEQIYKHEKTAAGYSKPISYVNKDKVDLKNAISITLDGFLYVLKNDGTILKLMTGKQVNDFNVRNVPESDTKLVNPVKIATSVDTTKLYILADNKIVELDKTGNYSKTYFANGINNITDFVLSYKNRKIYLLSDNRVYEFGI